MGQKIERSQWQQIIQQQKDQIILPSDFPNDAELRHTYQVARALDPLLLDYFNNVSFTIDKEQIQQGTESILTRFKAEILKGLHTKTLSDQTEKNAKNQRFSNIFEFAGCRKLYLSSIYTRVISENLGHKIEEIANLSPYIFNPESELSISLKGIDFIVFWQTDLYYGQMKTKKDTLTGSQGSRSINELRIHPRSMFIAALDMGAGTNPSKKKAEAAGIRLEVGESFWSKIGIGYSEMLNKIAATLRDIEQELYDE
ncbi:hypothetical protein H6F44_00160 [Pseudanabaena sp. FACHB-1277]|uniref:Restriction endonuclease n=1 Tax=Pseudanabaena cinerea FACHB-1277 TaxID=2949581 RepID=A0A926Z4G8_9CYAN|nr:hypothetical protein [Pseudanabaena cinerea]MBD2148552.1 hypothetical protein [Pseudanabaena cinerea FACHB-1277]